MPIKVASFDEIRAEFLARVERIVWCSVATVDRRDRPRSRVLHPIWEGSTGWILTGRHSAKEKHLAHNAQVSLCYWDPQQDTVYAECRSEWADAADERKRVWNLFASTPAPVGYDPALFWPGGPTDATFGVMRLTPWRIELSSLQELMTNTARIWIPRGDRR